ncbi:MAG: hypothetical protein ACJ731_00765 [Vicinamibacterales bacterium]
MSTISRLARVAFTFVTMNYAAIAGLVALSRGGEIWVGDSPDLGRRRS